MKPGLDPTNVPTFWFCPHCVEKEFNIPTTSPDTMSIMPTPPSNSTPEASSTRIIAELTETSSKKPNLSTDHTPASAAKSRPRPSDAEYRPARGKANTTKKSSSPPRKKSKYSAFSVQVDKALSVIYAELETAAEIGKSEGNLQNKVQLLEQRLKIQDGQLKIRDREFVFVRDQLVKSRVVPDRLQTENEELKKEVIRLQEMVQSKDAELKDWRAKLRTMMGNDLE